MNASLENLLDRPKSHKLGILGTMIVLIAAAFYFYLYRPQADEIAKLTENIEATRNEKAIKEKRASNLPKFQKEMNDLDLRLKEAVAQLPNQKEIADLLSSVATKAKEAGLEIVLFRPRAENYQDFYAEIPLEMIIKGTFHNIMVFFDGVGQLKRLVTIDNIGFKNPRVSGEQVVLDFTTTATTYRFLEETERKKIAEEKAKAAKSKR